MGVLDEADVGNVGGGGVIADIDHIALALVVGLGPVGPSVAGEDADGFVVGVECVLDAESHSGIGLPGISETIGADGVSVGG